MASKTHLISNHLSQRSIIPIIPFLRCIIVSCRSHWFGALLKAVPGRWTGTSPSTRPHAIPGPSLTPPTTIRPPSPHWATVSSEGSGWFIGIPLLFWRIAFFCGKCKYITLKKGLCKAMPGMCWQQYSMSLYLVPSTAYTAGCVRRVLGPLIASEKCLVG